MGQNQTTNNANQTVHSFFREDKTPLPGHSRELIHILHKDNPDIILPDEFNGCSTIQEIYQKTIKTYPNNKFLGTRDESQPGRPYVWKTHREIYDIVDLFARGIHQLGLSPAKNFDGDIFRFIGVHSRNREEWVVASIAGMRQGVTLVPFFDSLGKGALSFVINQTLLTTLCVEQKNLHFTLSLKKEDKIPSLEFIVVFEEPTSEQREEAQQVGIKLYSYREVIEAGSQHPEVILEEPKPDSIYMFCYTSGTTGDPKAAMISHKNVLSSSGYAILYQKEYNGMNTTDKSISLSYLPLAHIFEQCNILKSLIDGSGHGFYSGDPLKLFEDLQVLKPEFFIAVPRILTRIYAKIYEGVRTKGGMAEWLFNKAVETKLHNYKTTGELNHAFYDKVVFKKVRDIFGGNVTAMICGSAALDPKVLQFFRIAMSQQITEGYAQTETTCVGACSHSQDNTFGHVGIMNPTQKYRLRDVPEMNYYHTDNPPRGELQVFGNSVIKGYFMNPEKTAEIFSEDGWLCTGDVASIWPQGQVQIIDRAKNIFKLQQGEYIAPEKLQSIYGQCVAIQQIYIHGDSTREYLVAIAVPEIEVIKKIAQNNGLSTDDLNQLLNEKIVKETILKMMEETAKSFELTGLERVKKILLTLTPFTPENDLATPTMKVKRFNVRQHFEQQINQLYLE
eukprot:403373341